MKLTITCTCGREVHIPIRLAAQLLATNPHKPRNPEEHRRSAKKGAEVRWRKK